MTEQPQLRSGLYQGTVDHVRHQNPPHSFRYSLTIPLVFLDEVDALVARHPLWSRRWPAPVWFRRADYLAGCGTGAVTESLEETVRDVVATRLGWRPTGRVAMLGHLRTWGWLFNPITLYYCFSPDGRSVEALVMEVTNTPWKERHVYVLADGADVHRFAKEMHVSPFMGMDHDYVMSSSFPADSVTVRIGNRQGDEKVFDASLRLARKEPTRRELSRIVWRRPWATVGVSAAIYRQALALALRGARFYPHPRHRGRRGDGSGNSHPNYNPVEVSHG